MNIVFSEFPLDQSIVAPVIYGTTPHQTTSTGVILSKQVRKELCNFLDMLYTTTPMSFWMYYRIDAYFSVKECCLFILEINAAFVDGWGTALNLSRASGIQLPDRLLVFPELFATQNEIYLPELQLFRDELAARGDNQHTIVPWDPEKYKSGDEALYLYGKVSTDDYPNVFPGDNKRDNKMHLARLSKRWIGNYVHVPRHFTIQDTPWEDIPENAVLKFCDKESSACRRAGSSVLFGKPRGKAPFLNQCYRNGELLAQEYIAPERKDDLNCQLIIMGSLWDPIAGYVQYSPRRLINDNSIHGPLLIA